MGLSIGSCYFSSKQEADGISSYSRLCLLHLVEIFFQIFYTILNSTLRHAKKSCLTEKLGQTEAIYKFFYRFHFGPWLFTENLKQSFFRIYFSLAAKMRIFLKQGFQNQDYLIWTKTVFSKYLLDLSTNM